ncbi:hypothetical protein [Sporosarcina jiandibaonis]|uniref:hypothetical protein n=1 Tax=Sporosarcina jiandibaonis TaxID=2715535 RepID=UPI001551D3F1|nr:hypothetical protein [Sporosarcina jiandibaonis]
MTAHIYQEDLDFLQEAKEAFESDYTLFTYRNDDDSLIALRRGEDRDCIHIYRINEEVLFVHNVMERAPGEVQPVNKVRIDKAGEERIKSYFEKAVETGRNFRVGDTRRNYAKGKRKAVLDMLSVIGIKIEGVND